MMDHPSDLGVLYHLNARAILGFDLIYQTLQNIVNFHAGKPYLQMSRGRDSIRRTCIHHEQGQPVRTLTRRLGGNVVPASGSDFKFIRRGTP